MKGVVFDIGGVLEVNCDRDRSRLGLGAEEFNRRLASVWKAGSLGHISLEQVLQSIALEFSLSRAAADQLMEELWVDYLGELNQELLQYLAGLRPRYRTAILSNSFVGAREREQPYNFAQCVDHLIYSHEVGLAKPDPAIYQLTRQRLGLEPCEIVFLDDRADFLESARLCGWKTVHYTGDNARAIAELDLG